MSSLPVESWVPALLPNIKLGLKYFQTTNTLAYFACTSLTKEVFASTPGGNVIKLFFLRR
jgi:hypothetical protein